MKIALDKNEYVSDTRQMRKMNNIKFRLSMALLLAVLHITPVFAISSDIICAENMANSMAQPVSGDVAVDRIDKDKGGDRQNNGGPKCDGDMAKCSSCNLTITNPQDFQVFSEAHLNLPVSPSYHTFSSFLFDRPPQILS